MPRELSSASKLIMPRELSRASQLIKPRELSRAYKLIKPRELSRASQLIKPRELSRAYKLIMPRELSQLIVYSLNLRGFSQLCVNHTRLKISEAIRVENCGLFSDWATGWTNRGSIPRNCQ
jgi:hypothetical protein